MRLFECEAERPTLRTIYIYTHIRNINNLTSLLGLTESQNRKLKFTYGFVSLLFRLSYVIVKRLLRSGSLRAYTHLPRSKQALISLEELSSAHCLSIFLLPTVLGDHGDREGYNCNPDQDCDGN